ncbi:MAG: glycine cleavage system protein H [Rhodocyclales bacterium]|nr:glycine cleavage system protein H [Rhodocyclales bacterium]
MREIFHGTIPDGLLYDTGHDMWVRREGDEVVIGASSFGIHMAGEIIAFTAKPKGAEIGRGRGLGTVECAKTVLAVHAPVGFVLTQGNDALEERPQRLNRDPYAAWMARGTPLDWTTDSALLVDARAYRAHILRIEPEAVFE